VKNSCGGRDHEYNGYLRATRTLIFFIRELVVGERNRIASLARADGSITEDVHELQALARDFYEVLYTLEGTHGMEEVLALVPISVTTDMNMKLTAPFEDQKVKNCSFSDVSNKGTRPRWLPNTLLPTPLGSVW
jgi:hypothetical protein